MQTLDEKKWEAFALGDYFVLKRGHESKSTVTFGIGSLPFISAKKSGNGYRGFVENASSVFPKNSLTLNNNGDGGAGFGYYQPHEFTLDVNATALLPKSRMQLDIGLFWVSCFSWMHDFFGNACTLSNERAKKAKIFLPENDDADEPDFDYMEQYARAVHDVLHARYRAYAEQRIAEIGPFANVAPLSEKKWTVINVFGKDALFRIETTNSGIDGIRLEDGSGSQIPYITRSGINNGITRFVSDKNFEFGSDDAGCITVGLDTQTAFWQPSKFVTGQNIQIITGDNLNEYVAQFILPLFKAQMRAKFNWGGNGATLGRMKSLKLMLPVDDAGEPDFEYMEQYSKNMMLRKYQQYLSFIDRNNKA